MKKLCSHNKRNINDKEKQKYTKYFDHKRSPIINIIINLFNLFLRSFNIIQRLLRMLIDSLNQQLMLSYNRPEFFKKIGNIMQGAFNLLNCRATILRIHRFLQAHLRFHKLVAGNFIMYWILLRFYIYSLL